MAKSIVGAHGMQDHAETPTGTEANFSFVARPERAQGEGLVDIVAKIKARLGNDGSDHLPAEDEMAVISPGPEIRTAPKTLKRALCRRGEQFYLEDGSGDEGFEVYRRWDGTLAAGDFVVVNPGDEIIIRFNKTHVSPGEAPIFVYKGYAEVTEDGCLRIWGARGKQAAKGLFPADGSTDIVLLASNGNCIRFGRISELTDIEDECPPTGS